MQIIICFHVFPLLLSVVYCYVSSIFLLCEVPDLRFGCLWLSFQLFSFFRHRKCLRFLHFRNLFFVLFLNYLLIRGNHHHDVLFMVLFDFSQWLGHLFLQSVIANFLFWVYILGLDLFLFLYYTSRMRLGDIHFYRYLFRNSYYVCWLILGNVFFLYFPRWYYYICCICIRGCL